MSDVEPITTNDYNKKSLPYYLGHRLKWVLGQKTPLVAYLKVTKRCNLDCYYCPWHTNATDFLGELRTDEWKAIIRKVRSLGANILVFEGGEPTLRSDLSDLLRYAHSLDASTILATNGTGKPWKFSPTAFTVSIDGPERVHDKARGQGTFSKITRNLERKEARKVVSITVISNDTKDHLEEMCRETAHLLDGFLFTFLYPYKTATNNSVPQNEVAEIKRRIIKMKDKYRILNPRKYLSEPMSSLPCHDSLSLSVDHLGTVRHGCFVQHIETKNCGVCELGCFQLLSSFHRFNLESWLNLYRLLIDQ